MDSRFVRKPLPERFCNLERLLAAMTAQKLDGIVVSTPLNVFYLSGFNGIAHKADEPRPYAVLLSRHAPDHPILVLADYYLATILSQPTWVRDIRPFRAVMMPIDREPRREDLERFIPQQARQLAWVREARERYAFDMKSALTGALGELGLERGRVGFDDLALGQRLGLEQATVADAYDALMSARAVKTPTEIDLLRRASALNRAAIERTVKTWDKGMRWRELNRAYHAAALDLGGFVRDPGAMVWGHPRGAESALTLQTGLEDFQVERGQHVMFDCHGTLDLYCWDGGKTWVVGGEPRAEGRRNLRATAQVAEQLVSDMKPGARPSVLQGRGRELYRKAGVADADSAVIFFHGLGLSHWDLEDRSADWRFEAGMVVPLHVVLPGGETERAWLEEVVLITERGGQPLFGWGYEPLLA
ncbi:MAG TPA: M24 family metallopeptidase [Burkholderiales bacterium]|nr:M24 family metallopeptidase [Burkholderiales bacterium]